MSHPVPLSNKLVLPILSAPDSPRPVSCAQAVGAIFLEWIRQPYSLRRLKARIGEALGDNYPPLDMPVPPCFSEEEAAPASVGLARRRLRLVEWKWQDFLCTLLGQLVLVLDQLRQGHTTGLKSVPPILRFAIARRPAGYRISLPSVLRTFGPSIPTHTNAVPPDLSVFGPDWWTQLCLGKPSHGRGALVALDLRAGSALDPHLSILKRARNEGRPTAVWVLAGEITSELEGWKPHVDTWFASEASSCEAARAMMGQKVRLLGPAVQPLLQNPYGWWNPGDSRPRWCGEEHLPWHWCEVQDRARGLVESEGGCAGNLPAEWVQAGRRFLTVRKTLREETLEARLREACGYLGVNAGRPARPLISVLTCTHRPELCLSAIDSFARQRWPERELILLLHGPGFDLPAITARLQELPWASQVAQIPASWKLGDMMQLGFQLARGELVAPFEHDDWFGPRYLEDLVLMHRVSGTVVTGKSTLAVRFDGDTSMHLILPGRELSRHAPAGCNAIFRREVLELISWSSLGAWVDVRFYADCARLGVTMASTDRFNYMYRRGQLNTTSDVGQPLFLERTEALQISARSNVFDADL